MAGQPVARLGDLSKGENGFPPRPSIQGSSTVKANNLPIVRVGDQWAVHVKGVESHGAVSVRGSSNVFVEGKAVMRVDDLLSDGDRVWMGSPNVFCGSGEVTFVPATWASIATRWVETDISWSQV